uniref:CCT domain-containing protein n=1 Tax=Oryza nivara TaxID=4536 RepID=A0A0E0GME7_ORYNI
MGQDEVEVGAEKKDQELPEVEVVEEEEEEGSKKAAAGCDYCGDAAAVVYCRADAARLCLPCDRHVHGANGVCSRHARAPLCAACAAAGAVFRRGAGGFLCSNCDFSRHRHGGERDPAAPLHDRSTVLPYTGCPSALDLAALLGISYSDKAAAATAAAGGDDGGWWAIWEEPQVLSLEDLIVPTTSCHGFEPLLTPSSPKIQNSPDGKVNEEVIRQLTELANSDGGGAQIWAHREAAQAGDHQLPSWGTTTQHNTGHGNFGTANSNEVATMPTPGYENGGWDNSDYPALNDPCKVEFTYEQPPASSAEACISSFVQMSELCPSMSNGSSMEETHQTNPGNGTPMQVLPKMPEFVPCPDRNLVISRYKEKRKTRRFDRQVRYESRKARADSRLRIKGRFAKVNQI